MKATVPAADTGLIAAQIEAAYGTARLRMLGESFQMASPDLVLAILEQGSRLAQDYLAPLAAMGDSEGCRLVDGRVRTTAALQAAWKAFVEGGWPALDLSEAGGGQGLPTALAFAVQEMLDRHCPAFGMLGVPTRSAARLLGAFGDADLQGEWLPRLAAGEWSATICISEVDAGSDVARLRTTATPRQDGGWSIRGEKQWISFGDHDLTKRIGHCLLARTATAKGLSLFLVPDRIDGERNGVHVWRIEEKMGLHASPTCALGFEDARGWLIGSEGNGLRQMFTMITNMRLATGAQGLGIASGAADLALEYAGTRLQGGDGPKPVAIIRHADVQRMLLEMMARVETLRGLVITTANLADLAAHETDAEARADAAALLQWLLPIVKTSGGECGFDVASLAMQVLGGAGYTCEWPIEQALRDARVLTIFEGTTGMQALDLLRRRTLHGDRRGLRLFLSLARQEQCQALMPTLDLLEAAAQWLVEQRDANATRPAATDAAASAFLRLAQIAAAGWIAARLRRQPLERLAAAGRYWLAGSTDRADFAAAQMRTQAAAVAAAQACFPTEAG